MPVSTTTIGQVIHPSWSYDLEASLRVHRMLMLRAKDAKWRFPDRWVTTGPLESLCGYPNCGSSLGSTSWCELRLPVSSGLEAMTRRVNELILNAMCDYPGFASLDEALANRFVHCGDAVQELQGFEGGRTRKPLNRCHRRARIVRNVRLESHETGIWLQADVTLSSSRWGIFWLNRSKAPRWNERLKLATWLERSRNVLNDLVTPKVAQKGR